MNRLLLVAAFFVLVAGCTSSRQTVSSERPRSYVETADWLTRDIGLVDKHLIGDQFNLAEQEAERLVGYANDLAKFDPLRTGEEANDYHEFLAQCEDLRRSADRLLYLIQQRRRESAKDQLGVVAARYNRISRAFGPGNEVSLHERPAEKLRGLDTRKLELPGELIPSR